MLDEYMDFANEWAGNNEEIIPYAARLLDKSYDEWVHMLERIENPETCPDNLVDASTYFLIDGGRMIGALNLRHRLNEYLLTYGGHIGYGIRPSERDKGYATKMLAMALLIAKSRNMDKVLITCSKKNIASAKTILHNGGILENEVIENKRIVQRYWIEL